MILAGDVGGTKVDLALFAAEGARWVRRETTRVPTREVPDLAKFVAEFATRADDPVQAAAFGVAGVPADDGSVDGTNVNLPWVVTPEELTPALGGAPVRLLNDLIAAAHGLDDLRSDELHVLQEGAPSPGGRRALIAPGTGLGECLISGTGRDLVAIGTEGGHADFAPIDDDQLELWRGLRNQHRRVSWERAVSGPGIVNIWRWLNSLGGYAGDPGEAIDPESADAAAEIAAAATPGVSPLCAAVLRFWMQAFGAEAGNMALRGTTRGGVYLGGGIPAKILPLLEDGPFMKAFRGKAPHEPLMAEMPVMIVTAADLALRGAARYAAHHLLA